MERKQYWNEAYLRYWRDLTQGGAAPPAGAAAPPSIPSFEASLAHLAAMPGQRALDVGTGFGRLLPSLLAGGLEVYGVDISPAMVAAARNHFGNVTADLREAEAEALPYAADFFHVVICWAVFDACYQARAVAEFARVLRPGGKLLLSGKHTDYHDDDAAALTAEINARRKGHPNYFTDYDGLLGALARGGLQPTYTRFFPRRDDLAQNAGTAARPTQFYEYVLVAEKRQPGQAGAGPEIGAPFSRTFLRQAPPAQDPAP